MSQLTQNTLQRIDKWLGNGLSIDTMFPKLEQKYRMQLCYEFYKRWVQNNDIDPKTTCRNIARTRLCAVCGTGGQRGEGSTGNGDGTAY